MSQDKIFKNEQMKILYIKTCEIKQRLGRKGYL